MTEATQPPPEVDDDPVRLGPPVVSVASTSTATTIVVRYDGSRPPTAVFTAWAGLGWRPPVPAGPPRHAIDWSRPDPARGTSHTILPFAAIGSATLDEDRRRHTDELVRAALDVAAQLGCRVEQPDTDEIDLREPAAPAPVDPPPATVPTTSSAPSPAATPAPARGPRLRRTRGARARIRATVPVADLDHLVLVVTGYGGTFDHEPEPSPHADEEPLTRVTASVSATAADAVMRTLAARSTGTPTIEIVTLHDR